MKNTIVYTSLISALVLGLSACGGGGSGNGEGGGNTVSKFNGTWNGGCEAAANSRSFKQKWKINGTSLDNDISVWLSPNCQPGSGVVANGKASVEYQQEVTVANTCVDGKAQEVKVEYKTLKVAGRTYNGEQAIEGVLNPQGVKLPKYNLICIDANGKLHSGLLTTTNDGSTPAKRPTEVDPVKSFSP
jgi:hypothetical protein